MQTSPTTSTGIYSLLLIFDGSQPAKIRISLSKFLYISIYRDIRSAVLCDCRNILCRSNKEYTQGYHLKMGALQHLAKAAEEAMGPQRHCLLLPVQSVLLSPRCIETVPTPSPRCLHDKLRPTWTVAARNVEK